MNTDEQGPSKPTAIPLTFMFFKLENIYNVKL